MIARTSWFFLFVVCLGVGLAACVEERDSWIPQEIEIHEGEMLQDLGDVGHQLLCDAFDGYVHRTYRSVLLIQAACTAHALQTTRNATECAAVADACLQSLPAPVDDQVERILAQAGCGGVSSAGCGSMVYELITCLGDLGDAITNVKLTVTCAAFGSPIPSDWWRISPPASCLELARCAR